MNRDIIVHLCDRIFTLHFSNCILQWVVLASYQSVTVVKINHTCSCTSFQARMLSDFRHSVQDKFYNSPPCMTCISTLPFLLKCLGAYHIQSHHFHQSMPQTPHCIERWRRCTHHWYTGTGWSYTDLYIHM